MKYPKIAKYHFLIENDIDRHENLPSNAISMTWNVLESSTILFWNPSLETMITEVKHVAVRLKNPVELVCASSLLGAVSAAKTAPCIGFPAVDKILPSIVVDSQIQVSHASLSVPTRHVLLQSEIRWEKKSLFDLVSLYIYLQNFARCAYV